MLTWYVFFINLQIGYSALQIAAAEGYLEIVKQLIKSGSDVNAADNVVITWPYELSIAKIGNGPFSLCKYVNRFMWASYYSMETLLYTKPPGKDTAAR